MEKVSSNYLNHETKLCLSTLLNVYAAPDGHFYPCCVSRKLPQDRLLDMQGGSFLEAFNSDQIRSVRRQLASGDWPAVCIACKLSENVGRKSQRQLFNESSLGLHTDVISHVTPDGRVNYPIKSLDVRWNNTCNFKCRTCGPSFSSAWEKDYKALELNFNPTYDWSGIIETDEFLSILKDVTNLSFAGGEPLITDAHYQVLDKLIGIKVAENISLMYTTNLSVLQYKHYHLAELWKQFREVNLIFSLDGFGRAVEYSREGFNHSQFMRNFEELRKNENINFASHCVSSLFSILTIPDYIKFCQLNGIEDFSITCIVFPPYYSSSILSNDLKKMIRELYQKRLATIHYDYEFILADMDQTPERPLLMRTVFKQTTMKLDKLRKRQFCDYFPLFSNWFQSIRMIEK